MIGFAAGRLMEFEVQGLIDARYGECAPHGAGTAQRLSRQDLGDPCRVTEKALTAVIQEAYGRSVDELVKALGIAGILKSQISRLCAGSTSVCAPSSSAPSKATGPISGSMRLTRRRAKPGASSRSR
jgi:hypothetical protein